MTETRPVYHVTAQFDRPLAINEYTVPDECITYSKDDNVPDNMDVELLFSKSNMIKNGHVANINLSPE